MPRASSEDTPASRLSVPKRANNIFRNEGLETVAEVVEWAQPNNWKHLSTVHNLGPVTLARIRAAVGIEAAP